MSTNDRKAIYTITGFSMHPRFRDGDIVTGNIFDGTLKRGHCYGFHYKGSNVFHRYLCGRGNRLVFTGDNSSLYEVISQDAIFFTSDDLGPVWYNYSITVINLFFFYVYRINPCKTLKTVCARTLYYILKRERPPWMKKNPI